MRRTALAYAIALLLMPATAGAWITGWFEQTAVDGNGSLPGSYTFDLIAHPEGLPYYEEDWTAAGMYGTLTGGTFYQDPDNDTNPPDPSLFDEYPASEWSSFYTGPGAWPNPTVPDYPGVWFATEDDTETTLYTEWFDVVNTGDGVFTLARVTVLPETPDWSLVIDVRLARLSGDSLYEFTFEVPEPGMLGLYSVAALAFAGRRRR